MKRLGILFLTVTVCVFLAGCGNRQVEEINRLIAEIDQADILESEAKIGEALTLYEDLSEDQRDSVEDYTLLKEAKQKLDKALEVVKHVNDIITAIDFSNILASKVQITEAVDLYAEFTETQRSKVENYQALQEAESALKKALSEILPVQEKIDELKVKQTVEHSDVLDLKRMYEALSAEQQANVTDYESAIELRECEIVAIQAVKQLSSFLKSSSSLQLSKVTVKMDAISLIGDGVFIKYSATNSFGARIDDVACLMIGDNGTDPFVELARLTGKMDEIMTTSYLNYLKASEAEIQIDCERIMQNLHSVK